MKKYFLFLGLSCLICTLDIAQNNTIHRPQYETSNTSLFEIDKIELKDDTTILYCDVYNRVGMWVRISSNSYLKGHSGQVYKLLYSEGFELDKEVPMPPSGNISFKLFMEPLGVNENTFDFKEGEYENAFKVFGIKTFKPQASDAPIYCKLQGEVIDRPHSSRLVLTKERGDERISAIYIPIRNGKFEYTLNCQHIESYDLTFFDEMLNGAWRPIKFFSDSDSISFKLFPGEEFNKNIVIGGTTNKEYSTHLSKADSIFNIQQVQQQFDSLMKAGKYNSPECIELQNEINLANDRKQKDSLGILLSQMYNNGEAYTQEANELISHSQKLSQQIKDYDTDYIKNNSSIMAYSLLVNKMQEALDNPQEDLNDYIDSYNIYAKKYPKHPYTQKLCNIVESYTSIKVGGSFIDVSAKDFDGNPVVLSEQIKGKVALVDMWASWCGPCRKNAISMIPVYESYKDKGFTVVGIAREREISSGINAAKKDKYPWLNLIELNDSGKIWEKYGLGNSGGSSFLIDKDGTILAIHPSADELKKILDGLLK